MEHATGHYLRYKHATVLQVAQRVKARATISHTTCTKSGQGDKRTRATCMMGQLDTILSRTALLLPLSFLQLIFRVVRFE
eukprot:6171117-Amphidinium_carterae.2